MTGKAVRCWRGKAGGNIWLLKITRSYVEAHEEQTADPVSECRLAWQQKLYSFYRVLNSTC